jgi:hypothetical protein
VSSPVAGLPEEERRRQFAFAAGTAEVEFATSTSSEPRVAPIDPASLQRILAVRLDNAGDVILLGPALRALREAAPRARLTLLASPAGARAAELIPWVDEVWPSDVPWQDARGEHQASAQEERWIAFAS